MQLIYQVMGTVTRKQPAVQPQVDFTGYDVYLITTPDDRRIDAITQKLAE